MEIASNQSEFGSKIYRKIACPLCLTMESTFNLLLNYVNGQTHSKRGE